MPISLLTLCAPLVLSTAPTHELAGIRWHSGTWEQALDRAASEERMLWVELWFEGCGWCHKLHTETFVDEDVIASLNRAVCVDVDAQSALGKRLSEQYGVKGFPAMLAFTPDGEIEDAVFGFIPAANLVVEHARIEKGEKTLGEQPTPRRR